MSPSISLASQAIYILSLLPLITSAPIEELLDSRKALQSFAITQVPNPNWTGTNGLGPAALLRTYYKYGAQAPAAARKAVDNSSGTVTASPYPSEYDREYLSPVSLGTPAQILDLDFDTGSSDLWVFSSAIPKTQVSGQTLYNPSTSSTSSVLNNHTWSIQYGDGSACSGTVVNELVTIGGVSAPKQAVEIATQVSSSFTSDPASDGILGLAFGSINTVRPTKQKTWFDNVQPSLAAPLFTVDLKKSAVGTYEFGRIDNSRYNGTIGYSAINSRNGFWQFPLSGYAVGPGGFTNFSMDVIADTGTTLLMLPTRAVDAYYKNVVGSYYDTEYGAMVFPCASSLPEFVFGVGGYRGIIPGDHIRYGEINNTTCYGGLQSNEGLPFGILGDILLKAQFVVFDVGQNRIGFASKST